MSEAGEMAPASGPTITKRRVDPAIAAELRPTYAANAASGFARRRAELEAYKRENELLEAPELARLADIGRTAISKWARAGRLPAHRYPGAWHGPHRPWLFERKAVDVARELKAEGRRARSVDMAAKWESGKITSAMLVEPAKRRWQLGRGLKALIELQGGNARRFWKLKWVNRPGRPRLDARPDYEDALEKIRTKYEETHASERDLEHLTRESRTMVRLALGRPLGGRRTL